MVKDVTEFDVQVEPQTDVLVEQRQGDKIALAIARQIANEITVANEKVATRLLESTRELAQKVVQHNDFVADKLAIANRTLAEDLAASNRTIAEKLVTSTQTVASQLLVQNQEIAKTIEETSTFRFDRQTHLNWSLIAINAMICLILGFFGVAFFKYAIDAMMH